MNGERRQAKERTMTDGTDRPRGRYFEEFAVGDKVTSQGRTITESDIMTFAGFSGDYNPIHIDAEFSKTGLFGERIAHGLLVLSIASDRKSTRLNSSHVPY
jgi:acyl dehydratase